MIEGIGVVTFAARGGVDCMSLMSLGPAVEGET